MIKFNNLSTEEPYKILKQKYDEALNRGQKNIEAISISSYNKDENEVNSRYVNLKFIKEDKFIFFSNYNSPKSKAFNSHNQISAILFWPSINLQIRIKAKIKKVSDDYNQEYFSQRSEKKNALAISSKQSRQIGSFAEVKENFKKCLDNEDLKKCPKYWGGFAFKPYEIEFWEGNEFRLNKRTLYKKKKNAWHHFILEP
ncbi:pyridoxal 5'-phosphate synthase [Gammaproteobacteria bacterium]|nr:pyridoxal 5'-phosphate synthase [Gammaproteobacteria bacterium]